MVDQNRESAPPAGDDLTGMVRDLRRELAEYRREIAELRREVASRPTYHPPVIVDRTLRTDIYQPLLGPTWIGCSTNTSEPTPSAQWFVRSGSC
jgi:hypothetical protein